MHDASLKIDTASVALLKKKHDRTLDCCSLNKDRYSYQFFFFIELFILKKKTWRRKVVGMNKGLASLECVSFRPEIWAVLHYASELLRRRRRRKKKNRRQTEKVSKRRKPTEYWSIWFFLPLRLFRCFWKLVRNFAAFLQVRSKNESMERWAAGSLTCLRCSSAVWPLGGSTGPVSRMCHYCRVKSFVEFVRHCREENIRVIKKKKNKTWRNVCKKSETRQTRKFSFDLNGFVSPSTQGEDGFPGFKGDMGIKGDRVRACKKKKRK